MQKNTIRILLVEDNDDDAIQIRRLLEHKSIFNRYEVDWAESYERGCVLLLEKRHDIALFDYRLGNKNGVELLRACRTAGNQIPVILLTGAENPAIDREASEGGAADFLDKNGLDISRLERSIRYALRHASVLQALRQSQARLEAFMKFVPCAMAIKDREGDYLFVNSAFERMAGREQSELIGRNQAQLWPEEDPAKKSRPDRNRVASENAAQGVSSFEQDGREVHWLTTEFPIPDEEGSASMTGVAAVDITERVRAEEAIQQKNQLLKSITTHLPMIVGRIDASGIVTEAEGGGLPRFGKTRGDLLGVNLLEQLPRFREPIERALAGESVRFDIDGLRKGAPWHLETYLFFDSSRGEGAIFFSHDISEQKRLEKELLEISDEEQKRIGRDLHDGLGQQLTVISCLTKLLENRLSEKALPEAEDAKTVSSYVKEAISQARGLAHGLSPVHLETKGIIASLQTLAENVSTLHGIDCRMETENPLPIRDNRLALHLFRIAQESLNNAIKHARAQSILIRLRFSGTESVLSIKDDGIGFDFEKKKAESLGLQILEYRTRMIGGSLRVVSNPDEGTCIECSFLDGAGPSNRSAPSTTSDPSDRSTAEVT